jgi:alkylhydroperoxidase family enzyme
MVGAVEHEAAGTASGAAPGAPPHPTIASLLAPSSVAMPDLHDRYGALLQLVRRLIGVVPNCDPLLEIWPPGFRTYNLMVPSFLNLPALLFGVGVPKDVVGLAMYAASRTAGCAYCSAHTCSFALRRGTAPQKVVAAFGATEDGLHTPAERAAIELGEALSTIPSTFTPADRARLEKHFPPAQAEWLALAVAMMGFLNKFMDAAGVPLEEATVGEVGSLIGPSGWSPGRHLDHAVPNTAPPRADGFGTTLGVLRYAPSAAALDRRWTAGVPAKWPAVGEYLREQTGHNFPLLGRMRHARPRRALATILRDNLAPAGTRLGLPAKMLAGLVYSTVVGDDALADEARHLAMLAGVGEPTVEGVAAFAASRTGPGAGEDLAGGEASLAALDGVDEAGVSALVLAKACSSSPAQVTPQLIARAGVLLEAPAIVELLVWVSVEQLLHRLSAYLVPG